MKGARIAASFLLRFKWRLTAVLAVLLIAALALYGFVIYYRQAPKDGPVISVTMDKLLVGSIDRAMLDSLEEVRVFYDGVYYTAVPLPSILDMIDAMPTSGERVVCVGEEGEALTLSGQELIEPGEFYLAYDHDGRVLNERQGGPYLLLVFHADDTSQTLSGVRYLRIEPQQ